MSTNTPDKGQILTSGEVAEFWGVHPKTVNKWADAGKLPCFRTPGNQRRFYEADVRALLNGSGQ